MGGEQEIMRTLMHHTGWKAFLAAVVVLYLTQAAHADLLLMAFPTETYKTYRPFLELLGYQAAAQMHRKPLPPELQRLLDDLNATENWDTQKRALLLLQLHSEIDHLEEVHRRRGFRYSYDFKPHIITGNFDADPNQEYVLLIHSMIDNWHAPRILYIDETLSKRQPISYASAPMYNWFLLVKDVNRDGVQDFVLWAGQRIGVGSGYGFILLFNMVDGVLTPLARITLRCVHHGHPIPTQKLADELDLASFKPGDLSRFAVIRTYENSKEPYKPSYSPGGWKVRVSERLDYAWDNTQRRYVVRRSGRTEMVQRTPPSNFIVPKPTEVYEKFERICDSDGKRTYQRVP